MIRTRAPSGRWPRRRLPYSRPAMRALGRELVAPFGDYWRRVESEIGIPWELAENGHWTVFGDQAYIPASGRLPQWMELPDFALSFHVAHELTHVLMRKRGFPITGRGPQYAPNSHEARVGGDLEEMVGHPGLERILDPFPFDKSHIQQRLFEGARNGLENSPIPTQGSLWWMTWAMRFCELQFLLPEQMWLRLEVVYDGRCPDIAVKGRELVEIMLSEGFDVPDQALNAMVRCRNALGLQEEARCLITDPRDGKTY